MSLRTSPGRFASIARSWSNLQSLWEMLNPMPGLQISFIFIAMVCWLEVSLLHLLHTSLTFLRVESKKFIVQVLPPVRPAVRGERDLLVQRDWAKGGEDDHWEKRSRGWISKSWHLKPDYFQMNGTPRGRTSRMKQRRTESRQEQNFPLFSNFFQKILILLSWPSS